MTAGEIGHWLLENGGPAIRLRTAAELVPEKRGLDRGALRDAVLTTDRVRLLLSQADRFHPLPHMDIAALNSLHGMKPACLENAVARLLELGLRAGDRPLDRLMERFRGFIAHPLVERALAGDGFTVERWRAVFVAVVLSSFFLRGGYRFPEVVAFVRDRIDRLARLAAEKNYAVYLDGKERADVPAAWRDKPILRPEHDPASGARPLPYVHDLAAIAHFPPPLLTPDLRRKIDAICAYIADDRYRALRRGYGYVRYPDKPRTCYAVGWNLDLPVLDDPAPLARRAIVRRVELLSRLPAARSTWFASAFRFLDSFAAGRGTRLFPRDLLHEGKTGYFVCGAYMGLEEGKRTAKALEIESTFRMALVRKNLAARTSW